MATSSLFSPVSFTLLLNRRSHSGMFRLGLCGWCKREMNQPVEQIQAVLIILQKQLPVRTVVGG
ncbi:uncharacterized protein FFC1_15909 [Fusarium fujikuroi]|nr:uncharacterized protein FFC1_15909 [Fusarium fujikuroi]